MRFSWISATLVALYSVSFTLECCGELIMIRPPHKVENMKKVQNLTCMSEDDGSALVWNEKLDDSMKDVVFGGNYGVNKADCVNSSCFNWRGPPPDWSYVNNKEEPMGPVFDVRWQGLPDYESSKTYLQNLSDSGVIVFSARGSRDIHLRFGGEKKVANNSCFRITLAGSESTKSKICSCDGEGSNTTSKDDSCVGSTFNKRTLVNAFEWRTFIIKWNSKGKIEVEQASKDRTLGAEKIMNKSVGKWVDVDRLVVENRTGLRFRFHQYEYARTRKKDTYIILTGVKYSVKNIFIELQVILCPKCWLEVRVVTENKEILANETIYRNKMLPQNELLWQVEQRNISLSNYTPPIELRMSTRINGSAADGLWALGRGHIYKPKNVIKQSTRTFTPSDENSDFPCQKLSYDEKETSIVHSNGPIVNISSTSLDKYLPEVIKICDSERGGSCSGISVCNPDGCTCAPGFKGNDCAEECPRNYYGYNCAMSCENCKGRKCNRTTGCQSECLSNFLPPECEKKLETPRVSCIAENGLKLMYTPGLDVDQIKDLRFQMKKEGGTWTDVKLDLAQPSTWHWPNKTIQTLQGRQAYYMRAVLNNTRSQESSFNTMCWQPSKPQILSLIPQDNGTMIMKFKHSQHFWEETARFDVRIKLLESTLKGIQERNDPNMTVKAVKTKVIYEAELPLLTPTNYTFSVQAIDEDNTSSMPASIWYFLPNEATIENAEEWLENSTMRLIDFKLPYMENATEKSIVDVVMNKSSTCPNLTLPRNSQKIIRTPGGMEKNGYPACSLQFNVTYVFMVFVENESFWKSKLIWFIALPILAVLALLLYKKYKRPSITRNSLSMGYVSATKPQPITGPEQSTFDNGVSPEVQKLRSFENYVRNAAENGILQQQFKLLPRGLVRPNEYGRLPDNKSKNRYGNLIAYDETRVMLGRDSRGIHSDYINANYVQGYCKDKAYIATQGPLPETVVDFWKMIWLEEVRIICMLVDLVESGKNMCERYWPDVGKEMKYGDIVVSTSDQLVFTDYTYRTFILKMRHRTESQTVQHLQYTGWPDEGVPMYSHSIVEYLQKLLSLPPGQGPIVVHCSSGTGRTGAIILSDICRRNLAAEGTVDVFGEAQKMYTARGNMLRNFAQYVLAHLVPTQCLLMLPSKVLCSDVTQKKMEEMKQDLPAHIARLAESSWMDKALRLLEPLRPPVEENILKNRFPKLTPVGPSLVTLTRYPTYDENSDYISAVAVDGVKIRKQYIASQLPMPSTLTDFWRLIVENNIELVIILQQPDPDDDETCCDIIPRGTTLIPVPYLTVETKMRPNHNKHFRTDKLLLTDTSQKLPRTRRITALTCKRWSPTEDAQPPAPETLIELWKASEKIQRNGPTLVVCYNGVTGCGLYLTLSFMLDRMGVEQECDVILAVRAVRRSRPEFVSSQWEFEYLYDAAVKYVESMNDYANFTRTVGLNRWREQ